MRFISIFTISIFFALTHQAQTRATQNDSELSLSMLEMCFINSQAEARTCLRKLNIVSEEHLQQAYNNAITAIKKWDEESKYKVSALKKLKTSQIFYLKFRQTHCDYETSLGGGAVGLDTLKLRCIFLQNKHRIENIQNSVSQLIPLQSEQ